MVLVLRTLLKHENHFVNQTVRFQVQLEADGYFFLGSFRICNRSKQGDLVPTRKFLKLILQIRLQKHLLGFAQTRYSAQNCAGYTFPLIPNKQIFLEKKLFQKNQR